MLKWPPERSNLLLTACILTAVDWMARSILGHHPDGSLLTFSGTCLLAWSTVAAPARRARRRELEDEDEQEERDEDARLAEQASQDAQH